jgi:hypothetical protein
MDELLAALEEETPTRRRETIGVGITASTPSTTALSPETPAVSVPGRPSIGMAPVVSSGVTSVTAHVIKVEAQIAEFRAHGLNARADAMAASLTQYLHASVMGADTVVETPP